MNLRHKSREVAFQFLYQLDREPDTSATDTLQKQIETHFEHFETPTKSRTFSQQLIIGCVRNRNILDAIITKHAENWKIERVGPVERNLLRLGVFELLTMPDIGAAVTIDEAVEIGKLFGSEDTSKFVHGILDAVSKNRESLEEWVSQLTTEN